MMQLMNSEQQVLITQLKEAKSFSERSIGLLGRSSLADNEALWIHHCNSIHTFFMRFTIDCVFLDKKNKVKAIRSQVKPGRLVLPIWGASSVIEMCSGKAKDLGIKIGDQLYVGT